MSFPSFPSLGIDSSVNLGMPRNEHFLPRNNGTHLESIPRNFFGTKFRWKSLFERRRQSGSKKAKMVILILALLKYSTYPVTYLLQKPEGLSSDKQASLPSMSDPRRILRSSRPQEIFQPPQQGFFSVHGHLQLLGNIFQLSVLCTVLLSMFRIKISVL